MRIRMGVNRIATCNRNERVAASAGVAGEFRLANPAAACFLRRMFVSRREVLLTVSLAALALIGCSPEIPTAKPANAIRVVNWNLEWFPGGKPDALPEQQLAQMEAAKKAIGELQPDILLLQEVRDWAAA